MSGRERGGWSFEPCDKVWQSLVKDLGSRGIDRL